MTCVNCQKDIAVGSRFCYNCGAKQPETPAPGLSPQTGGKKKLMRSSTDKKIAGVCAGLADYFDLDPRSFGSCGYWPYSLAGRAFLLTSCFGSCSPWPGWDNTDLSDRGYLDYLQKSSP